MLYRRNEKGRYEGVTARKIVIGFEDEAEMLAFYELRAKLFGYIEKTEKVEMDEAAAKILVPEKEKATGIVKNKIKIRIYKGQYTTDGGKLIKKALA